MKTYQPKQDDVVRTWQLIDAKDQVLGRVSTKIAMILMGKGKATFSTHMDMGDYVVVLNCEKISLSGNKTSQKLYRRHSGYPGGYKEVTFEKMLEKHPDRIIYHAVSGMLPDNRLKSRRLKRLILVVGEKNPYEKKFVTTVEK
ncbi:MAG: 50S ribosomal protein L13 [Microgenomates group bacterium]